MNLALWFSKMNIQVYNTYIHTYMLHKYTLLHSKTSKKVDEMKDIIFDSGVYSSAILTLKHPIIRDGRQYFRTNNN